MGADPFVPLNARNLADVEPGRHVREQQRSAIECQAHAEGNCEPRAKPRAGDCGGGCLIREAPAEADVACAVTSGSEKGR